MTPRYGGYFYWLGLAWAGIWEEAILWIADGSLRLRHQGKAQWSMANLNAA